MSNLPKMLSKREIELEELEEAKYVQSLRDENQKLQEQLNTAKKSLTEIAEFEPKKSAHKYWPDWHSIMMTTASEALAAIGGNGTQ